VTELEALLIGKVSKEGSINFADYMQAALYHHEFGYYRTHTPGIDSDYATSPTLSPVFGRLMAVQLTKIWDRMERPSTFKVAEAGAGNGALARATLEWLQSQPENAALAGSLIWVFVEPFETIASIQRKSLSAVARVEWVQTIHDLGPFEGVILANEVLDNMPLHLLEATAGGVVEIMIGVAEGGLVEESQEIQDSKLIERAEQARTYLEPGDRFEVGFRAEEWVQEAAAALTSGCLIVIDYGETEPELWTRHPAGTVVTYTKGTLGLNPLEAPGRVDITGHVNFSWVQRAASAAGMSVEPLVTQKQWLSSLGIGALMDELRDSQVRATELGDSAEVLRLISERSRASSLVLKGGLGDLRVFVAARERVPLLLTEGPASQD